MAEGLVIERDVMAPMRDGVRLATDIFHAAGGEANAPVLLYRTPYCKDETERSLGFARWFAERGYTVVQQDCRGCYNSEGQVAYLTPEAEDGLDTLHWIEAQAWGKVNVGSFGTSWSGWTQTAMAVEGRSRLKTIVPMMSGADAWTSSVRHGGALELRWIAWAFWHSAENRQAALGKTPAMEEALVHPRVRFQDWLRRWPISPGQTQLALTPAYEAWAFELLKGEDRSAFWESRSLAPARYAAALSGVSALYISSWYDSYARGEAELYRAHRDAGAARVRLMMGSWLHGTASVEDGTAGGVALGPEAAIADYKALLLAWFDRELKGFGPGVQENAPARIFVMGGGSGKLDAAGRLEHGGHWRDEAEWPLARAQQRVWRLHGDGSLRDAAQASDAAPLTFSYDPADPVPTIGGCVSSLAVVAAETMSVEDYIRRPDAERRISLTPAGGFDQNATDTTFQLVPRPGPLADRPDVLVFQTDPLVAPLELTGSVRVRLWAATDAEDTDFTAKLLDVYPASKDLPDGFALNLTDSILRLRYRKGDGRSWPVKPGTIYEIEIELYPTSNLFAAAHRIRLDISSSNYPRFDRNPNNGRSPTEPGAAMVARNTIYCDAAHPSCIVAPVILALPA